MNGASSIGAKVALPTVPRMIVTATLDCATP